MINSYKIINFKLYKKRYKFVYTKQVNSLIIYNVSC